MKDIIDMAADRGAFIDQSQSLNMFIAEPNFSKLTSMHFYAWKKGLKTGMYYLRTQPAAQAIKFTVAQEVASANPASKDEFAIASAEPSNFNKLIPEVEAEEDGCVSCGS